MKEFISKRGEIAEFVKNFTLPGSPRVFQTEYHNNQEITCHIQEEKLYGIVCCDITIPKEERAKCSDFPPIFTHKTIGREDLCKPMLDYALQYELLKQPQKRLCTLFESKEGTYSTSYIKYLVDTFDAKLSNITHIIQFSPSTIFEEFYRFCRDGRKQASMENNDLLESLYKGALTLT